MKFPVRIKCATLSWNTLAQGLDEAAADRQLIGPSTQPAGTSQDHAHHRRVVAQILARRAC